MQALKGAKFTRVKDNSRQTGAESCHVPFEHELEEIFGDRPIISNVSTNKISGSPTAALACTIKHRLSAETVNIVDEDDEPLSSISTKKPKPCAKTKRKDFSAEKLALKSEYYPVNTVTLPERFCNVIFFS